MATMMKCGHASQGIDGDGKPVCVICYPEPGATQVDDNAPDLAGRKARCAYYGQRKSRGGGCDYPRGEKEKSDHCHCITDSDSNLPFFNHKPNSEYDDYYCGCGGWD